MVSPQVVFTLLIFLTVQIYKFYLFCFVYFVYPVKYTSWFDHVLEYWADRHNEQTLALKYEDIKRVCDDFLTFSIKPPPSPPPQKKSLVSGHKSASKLCGEICDTVSQRGVWVSFGHPVSILDTLFHLSFTRKSIVSEQFGHPVLKVPANLDTLFLNPG